MRRLLDALYAASGALAALGVFAIFAVMLGASLLRVAGGQTGGTDDIVSWLTAAAAFFGLAHTFKHGDFVRVELLLSRLSRPVRRWVELWCLGVSALFVGYLCVSVIRYVHESWMFNDMGTGLIALPLWIPQSSFAVGSLLLLIALVDEFVIVLRGGVPTYVRLAQERLDRGDFSETL